MAERKRVMVFIDGSNFYHALKTTRRDPRVDFRYLVDALVGPDRELVRVYYYNAPVNRAEVPEQYKRQQSFFGGIRRLPYFELRLGRLVRRAHGMVEKGVDVRLATDMVAAGLRDRYDVAVLVTGDGDFADAVQIVKDAGKHVELAYPHVSNLARHLLDVCDVFTPSRTAGTFARRPARPGNGGASHVDGQGRSGPAEH